MIVVHRLKLTKEEGVWGYDKAEARDIEAGNDHAAMWWQEPTTLAVVVMKGKTEDARYEKAIVREHPDRLPPGWPQPPAKLRLREDEPATPGSVTSALPPTLFDQEPRKKAPDGTGCLCCMLPRDPEADPDDTDGTPSGRIHGKRCPVCGALMRVNTAAIWQMYLAYQKRIGAEHGARHKPWNPQ